MMQSLWFYAFLVILVQCASTENVCPRGCYCTRRTASCTSPKLPLLLPSGVLKLQITGNIGDLIQDSIILPDGENLKSLTFQSATVGIIHSRALSALQLKEITFRKVSIGRILGNAFTKTSVQTVYFRESTIQLISNASFSGMNSEHFHFLLSNITTIESGSFKDLMLSEALTFSLCQLINIKEAAFNVTFPLMLSMNTFDHFEIDPSTFVMFSYNRLNCTCDLVWMWSSKYDYKEDLGYNKCIAPSSLKNVYLDEVNSSSLCVQKSNK